MILPKDLILLSSLIVLRISAAFKIPTESPWINIAPKPGNINYLILKIILIK